MDLVRQPLASVTARWACERRRDSMCDTARRRSHVQLAEPTAEPGFARWEASAVGGGR